MVFAKIDFPEAYSFAAPKTQLWGFNRSPFRMTLLLLSFGKILLPSNDEVRKQRGDGCNDLYREVPMETKEQKRDRKAARLSCRYAALGHPNKRGALLYSEAIIKTLEAASIADALLKIIVRQETLS